MKKMRLGLICLALGLFSMTGLSANASCGFPPQCSTDAECVARCGPDSGGGRCHVVGTCFRVCICEL